MQYSQYEFALDEAFKKWLPIISEAVAKIVIKEMEQRFKVDYIAKTSQKNNVQEVKNG
jgi:hypothetical protein